MQVDKKIRANKQDRENQGGAGVTMDKDKGALVAICRIMKEDETLDALAEFWQEEIYENSEKKCYKDLRNKVKGLTAELAEEEEKIKGSDNEDNEDEEKFYHKWEVGEDKQNRGPDRCTLGHALQLCENTTLLTVDEDDEHTFKPVQQGECKFKYCKKIQQADDDDANQNQKVVIIYYQSEKFYACTWDCCHFAVHYECYGGEKKDIQLKDLVKDKVKEGELKHELEEEKEVELQSYLVENGRRRTPYDCAPKGGRQYEIKEFMLRCQNKSVFELRQRQLEESKGNPQ